jgi:hypothetical protein
MENTLAMMMMMVSMKSMSILKKVSGLYYGLGYAHIVEPP